jgi:hypothetical protein
VNEQEPGLASSPGLADVRPPDVPKLPYEPPRLTVMNEDEVLSAFQVPVVAGSWWG